MSDKGRLMLIEDDAAAARLIREMLRDATDLEDYLIKGMVDRHHL